LCTPDFCTGPLFIVVVHLLTKERERERVGGLPDCTSDRHWLLHFTSNLNMNARIDIPSFFSLLFPLCK